MWSVVYIAVAVVLLVVASVAVFRILKNIEKEKRRKSHEDFLENRYKTHDEYASIYKSALSKLSVNWKVIEIIHDLADYPLGPAGLPVRISHEEAFDVVRRIRAAQHGDLAIVLHTAGGYTGPTDMIAMALKQHRGKKVTFVPYTAMSGGTLIALATSAICMGDTAFLGPIDTQIGPFSGNAFKHLRDNKEANHIGDEMLMASYLMQQLKEGEVPRAEKLIDEAHGPGVATALIAAGRPHGDLITKKEAHDLGIALSNEPLPPEVYELVDARLQMAAKEREAVFKRGFGL
jgi:ClpP class serine protease